MIGFTKSVAREVASRNIRVNVIAPGMIESDMTAILSDKIKEATLAQIPMKEFGQAEQVADLTVFLAGQDYLTGQVIAIDGGLSM
ncbi:3-oxoacyl-ACP reductase [Streptococcus pneumoniae]|nr:3-oxoacyl-ACP reductase [Streptococcus pneumoniae]CKL62706.1 3-oxoacyl-ACP reductase [Streptococcus pneumoniae]SNJ96835.1 3-oxoacyl-ACP reductase [Streptococcus pneumoniae]